jgi:hypothetical protein
VLGNVVVVVVVVVLVDGLGLVEGFALIIGPLATNATPANARSLRRPNSNSSPITSRQSRPCSIEHRA